MGDRKPKKTSSGNADAYKAKKAKHIADQAIVPPQPDAKSKDKKK